MVLCWIYNVDAKFKELVILIGLIELYLLNKGYLSFLTKLRYRVYIKLDIFSLDYIVCSLVD